MSKQISALLEKKELAEALEGLSADNIIEGGRRSRRSAAPAPAPAPVSKSDSKPSAAKYALGEDGILCRCCIVDAAAAAAAVAGGS